MLLLLVIGLIVGILLRKAGKAMERPSADQCHINLQFYDGPVPTKAEVIANKHSVYSIIENFPDGIVAKSNPDIVEEYLNSIDLDLPSGVHTQK